MDLRIDGNRIRFDKQTKEILEMFAKCDLVSLSGFASNIFTFVPEFMQVTTAGGVSFVNKMNKINSVETDSILRSPQRDENQELTYFEFQSTLNFKENKGKLEISVTLNGVTKCEQNGKTTTRNNSEMTSSTRLIYDPLDHTGMLIDKIGQPEETKLCFKDKDGIVVDCQNLLLLNSQKNTEENIENNTEKNIINPEINKK